jgi:hypothetical protein
MPDDYNFQRSTIFLAVLFLLSANVVITARDFSQEGVFVHTDRDIYVAGETLLYKAYLIQDAGSRTAASGIAYMALRNQYGTVNKMILPMQERVNEGNFFLDDTLSSGWYELVAFTNRMREAGEGSYFRKTLFIANRFDHDLAVLNPGKYHGLPAENEGTCADAPESLKNQTIREEQAHTGGPLHLVMGEQFGTREEVWMRISLEEIPATFATLSLSVSQTGACNEAGLRLVDYILQPGNRSRPGAGVSRTRGSIPSGYAPGSAPSDYAETNAYILQGRVTDPLDGSAVEDVWVILNTPGPGVTYLHAVSGADGRFGISLPAYFNGRDLFLSADPETIPETAGGNVAIEVEDKFAFTSELRPGIIPDMQGRAEFISRCQEVVKAMKAFEMEYFRRTGRQVLPVSPPSFLFSQPRLTIRPDQYTSFENLHEIAREIVPPWRIRESNGSFRSQLHCADTGSPLPGNPLYFVDGIVVHDLGRLISLQSGSIERLLVHNTQWTYNGLGFHGAINIVTRNNDYLELIPRDGYKTARFDYHLKERSFNPPAYPNGSFVDRERPDLRQTLYWNPDIRIRRGGSMEFRFYTGDLPGEYRVRIEGVTSDGEGVSLLRKFTVGL